MRALVGKHQHYRRLFGGSRAAVYEFDGCNDSLASLGSAVISYWPYPRKVYKWYKSAEVHNKQKYKLPKWLLIPVAGALMGIYFIPAAYSTLSSGMKGEGLPTHQVKVDPKLKTISVIAVAAASSPAAASTIANRHEVPDTPFTRPEVLAAACMATAFWLNFGRRIKSGALGMLALICTAFWLPEQKEKAAFLDTHNVYYVKLHTRCLFNTGRYDLLTADTWFEKSGHMV